MNDLVMKLVDTSKSSKNTFKLKHEISVYQILESIQDEVIAVVHDSIMINNWMLALVMKNAGEPIAHQAFVERYDEIMQKVIKIHQLGVTHCDLKLQNIMIDDEFNITIIDFSDAVQNNSEECQKDLDMLAQSDNSF